MKNYCGNCHHWSSFGCWGTDLQKPNKANKNFIVQSKGFCNAKESKRKRWNFHPACDKFLKKERPILIGSGKTLEEITIEVYNLITLNKLICSFNENFKNIKDNIDKYSGTFNFLSKEISRLDFDDCFVDIDQKTESISIVLKLTNGLFVTITKKINELDEKVKFSINEISHQTIVTDTSLLKELIEKLILFE